MNRQVQRKVEGAYRSNWANGKAADQALFPGGILVPQTFWGMANWNPHVHALITDACRDRQGKQYAMPLISNADLKVIEELFAATVFRLLLEEGMISEELVEKMSSWKHSGFRDFPGTTSFWLFWFQRSFWKPCQG